MGDSGGGGGGLSDGKDWSTPSGAGAGAGAGVGSSDLELDLDLELDDSIASMSLEELWSAEFLPPPPRPTFFQPHVPPDGLTTCDICNWALQDLPGYNSSQGSERISWALTLTIVSLVSAILGAFVMLVLLHCRRNVNDCDSSHNGTVINVSRGVRKREMVNLTSTGVGGELRRVGVGVGVGPLELNKDNARQSSSSSSSASSAGVAARSPPAKKRGRSRRRTLIAWLTQGRRKEVPAQLGTPMCSIPAATNHYTCTNLDEPYNPVSEVSEAVYAELDRVPTPAYQNTSYLDSCDAAADPGVPTTATLPNNHNHNFYTDIIPVHYEQVNNYNGAVYSRGNHAVPSDYI